jgi:hypothetical protein
MFCLVSQATEGKTVLLTKENAAVDNDLFRGSVAAPYDDGEDAVPEELFRRYTDTDSRPLTPAPTLASVMTRGSIRRCVTPDPIPTHTLSPARQRTVLVLDLHRSYSQDTLSWQGFSLPTKTSLQPLNRTISPVQVGEELQVPQKKKINVKKKGAVSPKNEESDRSVNEKVWHF